MVAKKARSPRKVSAKGVAVGRTHAASGTASPASLAVKRTRALRAEEMKSSMLHIRLDNALKDDVQKTLDKIGISLSEAIRVFLKRTVREQALPFRLEVPNAETARALEESIATTDRKRYASAEGMFDDLEKGGVH